MVYEEVSATIFWCDKSEAFLVVKPLYCSFTHFLLHCFAPGSDDLNFEAIQPVDSRGTHPRAGYMAFATIKKRVALQAPVSIHFTYDTRSLPTIINCFHITHTKWRVSVERVKALELLFLEEGSNYMLGGF